MAGATKGSRHTTCLHLASFWTALLGGQEEMVLCILRAWADNCTPPLRERDLQKALRSVRRFIARRRESRSLIAVG